MRSHLSVKDCDCVITGLEWNEEKWMELCEEAEDDFTGLTLSLLISLAARFAILGTLPNTWDNDPKYKTKNEMFALFFATVFIIVLCVAFHFAMKKFPKIHEYTTLERGLQVTFQTLWMTVAWMFLSLITWMYFYTTSDKGIAGGLGGKMTARIIIALFIFALFVVSSYSFQIFANRFNPKVETIRIFVLFWSLLLGLSFKDVFKQALKSVANEFSDSNLSLCVDVGLRAGLLFLVIPAWLNYVLPHALKCFDDLSTQLGSSRRNSALQLVDIDS
jgi:hypothetical protein